MARHESAWLFHRVCPKDATIMPLVFRRMIYVFGNDPGSLPLLGTGPTSPRTRRPTRRQAPSTTSLTPRSHTTHRTATTPTSAATTITVYTAAVNAA